MVWVHGPFPCGVWPEIKIAQLALVNVMDDGEKIVADGGYKGEQCFVTPNGLNNFDQQKKSDVRAHHEPVNARLKKWGTLKNTFHHHPKKHAAVFHAAANICQLEIMMGEPLFDVDYDDFD
jgi:hypothetical protein